MPVLVFSKEINFNRDIRPIRAEDCFYCHGVDEKKREADLPMDIRKDALASAAWPYKPVINGFLRDRPSA
jgi:hypothetical protein